MAKTIITAALTGAVTPAGYKIPETPQQIANEAYDAWKLGAAVVHLHMRAGDGLAPWTRRSSARPSSSSAATRTAT